MFRLFTALVVAAMAATALIAGEADAAEVNLYSARHYDTDLRSEERRVGKEC